MTSVCRLCLNCTSENYQEWKTIDQKYFETVLPEIDLEMINSSVLCSNCVDLLRTAYLFKSNCLETERLIKAYMERVGGPENASLVEMLKMDTAAVQGDDDDNIKVEKSEIQIEFYDNFSDRDDSASDDGKRFFCSACNISFEDEGSLKRHKHAGTLRCAVCNKNYSNAYNLRRHMLVHKKSANSVNEPTEQVEQVENEVGVERIQEVENEAPSIPDELTQNFLCEVCKESFESKTDLLEHVGSHFGIKCEKCGKQCEDLETLETHMSESHVEEVPVDKSFSCGICFRIYDARKLLLSHIRTHFEKPRCKTCDHTYYDIGCLKRHMLTAHKFLEDSDDENEFDDVDFEVDEVNMMAALNKHLEKYKLRVENSEELKDDVDDRPFICEICDKTYNVKDHLDDHLKTHFCRPMCTICNRGYYNFHCLKRHMSTIHNLEMKPNDSELDDTVRFEYLDDPAPCSTCNNSPCYCVNSLKCNICGKVMGNRSSFLRHKLTHSKRKNFICDFCQKGFLTKLYLQRHINTTHLGVPRKRSSNHIFTCDTCGLTTNNKHTLIQHIRTHTGERPYKCDLCGKAFVQSSTLGTHKRTVHSTERLFTCEYCSKSFNTKGSLTKHILEVHMVDKIEKKFVCNFCGKKYRLQSQLTCHLKWHSSERQFSCDICGKPFVDRHSVKKHRVIHFSEKQHKCEICGKGFHQKYNIKIHMKVHSRVP